VVLSSRAKKSVFTVRYLPAPRKRRVVKKPGASDTLINIGLALLATGLTTVNVGIKVAVDAYQDVKAMLNPTNHLPGWLGGSEWNTGGRVLKKGDTVAGFIVTSTYGPRPSPGGIDSTFHRGIDLAMPVGTPFYNPGGNWECLNSGSGGIGARGVVRGYTITLWHLSRCIGGSGPVIGYSGNTGNSTGPHFHGDYKDPEGNWVEDITENMVLPFLVQGKGSSGVDWGFIQSLEGFSHTPYWDGAQTSIGHGTKANGRSYITREQAKQEMKDYVTQKCLPAFEGRGLSPGQLTAAVSFCYNTGTTSGWDIHREFYPGGSPNFLGYTRSTTGASLASRRRKEQAMWDGG